MLGAENIVDENNTMGQEELQASNQEDSNGGARPKGKNDQEKHLELYSELLASVKKLSSDMSHYNKRFNELASRVDSTDNRTNTHVTRSRES